MTAFLREARRELRSGAPYLIWALVSVIVVVTGPFGTYGNLDLTQRMIFWLPVIALGVCITTCIRAYVYSIRELQSFQIESLVVAGLVMLVLSPPLYALPLFLPHIPQVRPSLFEVAVVIWSTSMGVLALRAALETADSAPSEPESKQAPISAASRLMTRIERDNCQELLAISVRDHYVDVRTRTGIRSVLLRLSDAIAEAGPVDGVQVHRSHWVAWRAIDKVEQKGPKTVLRLVDGAEVPVSRANVGKLVERGLL